MITAGRFDWSLDSELICDVIRNNRSRLKIVLKTKDDPFFLNVGSGTTQKFSESTRSWILDN